MAAQDDITRIRIGEHAVGIIGLTKVLEQIAKEHSDRSEDEIHAELIRRLSKLNYIPPEARSSYAEAFFREYNKFLGRPYKENPFEGLDIKVLGPGCSRCDTLEQTAMEVVAEMGLAAGVEHITEIKKIAEYGVMGTPALVINGKVMSVGSIPSKEMIKKWLQKIE